MLSYLHAYHAGNYADVLKHLVLVQVLKYLTLKDKPLCYLDTHSGSGLYKLSSKEANKTGEYKNGIEALWQLSSVPPALGDYLDAVKQVNPNKELRYYPGSCMIAANALRPFDRLILCELHPSEALALEKNFARRGNVYCCAEDGFKKGIASVPPIERRGLMLVDPSYEVKSDYHTVVEHLKACHRRFAIGVYLLWYPIVDQTRSDHLLRAIRSSGIPAVDLYELGIDRDHSKPGMTGSGMIVVNPTYGLREAVAEALPVIAECMGPGSYFRSEEWVS